MKEVLDFTRLFAELYDLHPQAILWLRPLFEADGTTIRDFEFAYCNDEGLNYLNLAREQLQGLRVSNAPTFTDSLRKTILEEMARVYYTGAQMETSIYNPILNKYFRVLRTRLRDGVLTVLQDRTEENHIIRELQQKTEQLQEREYLLSSLLHLSPSGISVIRVIRDTGGAVMDGRTILANERSFEFTGLPAELMGNRTLGEIDPDLLRSPLFQQALETLRTGEPFYTQYYFSPTQRWLEISVAKMDDNHLVSIFTDITATKAAQLQRQQEAERVHAVFEAVHSGMFTFSPVTDAKGEIIDFRFVISNPLFASYMGQTPEALQGELGSAFFPGYLQNGMFAMYKRTWLTGETMQQDVHYHVEGHDLYLDLKSIKIGDEVLVTVTDYTVLKKTQLRLERLVEELKRSNTSLEEFAHAASHDLKEPIRKIHVFTDRLEGSIGSRLTEGERSVFEKMKKATSHMTALVDDLLSYSVVSSTPPKMSDINLDHLLKGVLTDLEILIEEKKAVITAGHLPTVKGYRRQLQQLLLNLVSNALKYSKPDVPPHIHITGRVVHGADSATGLPAEDEDQAYYLVEVQDNGIGFEQEYAEKIFKMFQRLHAKNEYGGTGVGLSIARKVADNHHGHLWATGQPGEGATFHLLLPVVEE